MLEMIPRDEELCILMGEDKHKIWRNLREFIEVNYTMESLWDKGGKTGVYELKYRKSGKTLCALYPKENGLRILIVLGKAEREIFEASRADFSDYINDFYNKTHQYHDGKWLYLDIISHELAEDIKKLLVIKKKPNRKQVSI